MIIGLPGIERLSVKNSYSISEKIVFVFPYFHKKDPPISNPKSRPEPLPKQSSFPSIPAKYLTDLAPVIISKTEEEILFSMEKGVLN